MMLRTDSETTAQYVLKLVLFLSASVTVVTIIVILAFFLHEDAADVRIRQAREKDAKQEEQRLPRAAQCRESR